MAAPHWHRDSDLPLDNSKTGSELVAGADRPLHVDREKPNPDGALPANWSTRNGLWLVAFVTVAAQLVGSAFNIWYNAVQIEPLLTPGQHRSFLTAVLVYNVAVYPVAVWIWCRVVLALRAPFRRLIAGKSVPEDVLWRSRRRAINLPWYGVLVALPCWLACIPVFLITLSMSTEPLDPLIYFHMPVSLIIAGLIAVTHAFFATELLSQSLLFPVLFQDALPTGIPGTWPLTLRGRGILWAVAAGVCPIGSLMLLVAVSSTAGRAVPTEFAITVGLLAIFFGLATAALLARLVAEPVRELTAAARAVADGRLDVRINLLRADEFGPLIDEFNTMVEELREKERLQETFGRHVGQAAAKQILSHDAGVSGTERLLTVLFADLRGFTARCSHTTPREAVALLNEFLTEMVDVVESRHGGMVNKFLGDGFMALFGADGVGDAHADRAVAAGREMLDRMVLLNERLSERGLAHLSVGIGIHTGPALVGSIGSTRRLEYTAIGQTVNVASRVESLTKPVGRPLLITADTQAKLSGRFRLEKLPDQPVKGLDAPLSVYSVDAAE